MDALSGGASALAFVGLAGKLGSGLLKIYQFWNSIEDAPDDIRSIAREIFFISQLLDEIAHEEAQYLSRLTTTIALQNCSEAVERLNAVIHDIELGMNNETWRVRKWSSIKATLRKEKIRGLQVLLSENKCSLSLCMQSSLSRKTRMQLESLSRQVATLQTEPQSWALTISSTPTPAAQNTPEIENTAKVLLSSIPNPVYRAGLGQLLEQAFTVQQKSVGTSTDIVEEPVSEVESENHDLPTETTRPAIQVDEPSSPRIFTSGRICVDAGQTVLTHRWKSILGKVTIQKVSMLSRQKRYEKDNLLEKGVQIHLVLRPSKWLVKMGIRYEACVRMSRSLEGLNFSKDIVRMIPPNSTILEYCKNGNIEGVKVLLGNGQASVRDIDPCGRTPLHYAAEGYHVELCQLLINEGAVPRCDESNLSPFAMSLYGTNYSRQSNATGFIADSAMCEKQIATQRLLLESHPEEHTLTMLLFLIKNYYAVRSWPNSILLVCFNTLLRSSVVLQADLQYLSDNLNFIDIARRLWKNSRLWETRGFPSSVLDEYDEALDHFAIVNGHPSVAHSYVFASRTSSDLRSLIDKGANIHSVAYTVDPNYAVSPNPDNIRSKSIHSLTNTPTSLAMYTSDSFYRWREALKSSGTNLERFVAREIGEDSGSSKTMPLFDSGWTKNSLLSLLDSEFVPSSCEKSCQCPSGTRGPVLKQPKWLRFLGSIKIDKVRVRTKLAESNKIQNSTLREESEGSITAKSDFCVPDHNGCYLCEFCWLKNGYGDEFWGLRDLEC